MVCLLQSLIILSPFTISSWMCDHYVYFNTPNMLNKDMMWEMRMQTGWHFCSKDSTKDTKQQRKQWYTVFWECRTNPIQEIMTAANRRKKKKQSRVTSVCNNSPIPLDQKHLKLLCWIKIEFSLLSYSPYHQQCIIPARSAGSCRSGLQRFTSQYLCFGKCWLGDCSDWVNVKD